MRCKELKKYLESLKLPMYVWLSEDATRITSKIEFDPKTNQMVGIVLPMEECNGMPINPEEIRKNMQKNKSNNAYVVMAQPLVENIPPFMIQLFGTDNKFRAKDVILRWRHTIQELDR